MASYDSDESMSDDEYGTSTNVLLGYPSKEETDDAVSHLGGEPVRCFLTILCSKRQGRRRSKVRKWSDSPLT